VVKAARASVKEFQFQLLDIAETNKGVNVHPAGWNLHYRWQAGSRLQAGTVTGTTRSDAQRALCHITSYLQNLNVCALRDVADSLKHSPPTVKSYSRAELFELFYIMIVDNDTYRDIRYGRNHRP
jgi:hypothetical protein